MRRLFLVFADGSLVFVRTKDTFETIRNSASVADCEARHGKLEHIGFTEALMKNAIR